MIVYHGSDIIVKAPKIVSSDRLLDFGIGFYTTTNKDQALRWAHKVGIRRNTDSKYLSIYEIDIEQADKLLEILTFTQANEDWLTFVCACRSGKTIIEKYDIVIGPVADDNVYTTVKLFETGVLNKEETIKRLKVENLFDQVLFHTQEALAFCKFIDAINVGGRGNG